jgi:glycerophosphoryl diester phosphodiesterase
VERVTFGSFRHELLDVIRASGVPVATSAATPEALRAVLRSALGLGLGRVPYQLFQLPEWRRGWRVITPRFVGAARRAGVPVQVWVVDDEADMRRLLGWGVTGLISDRPDIAVRVVRA